MVAVVSFPPRGPVRGSKNVFVLFFLSSFPCLLSFRLLPSVTHHSHLFSTLAAVGPDSFSFLPPPTVATQLTCTQILYSDFFFFFSVRTPRMKNLWAQGWNFRGEKNPGRLISVLGALKSRARTCSRTHTSSCLSSLHNSSKHSRASFQMMIALNHFSQFGPISFRLWSKRIIPVFSQHPSLWNFGFFVVCALALFMS